MLEDRDDEAFHVFYGIDEIEAGSFLCVRCSRVGRENVEEYLVLIVWVVGRF